MHGATARLAMSEVNSEDPHHFYEFFFKLNQHFNMGLLMGERLVKCRVTSLAIITIALFKMCAIIFRLA